VDVTDLPRRIAVIAGLDQPVRRDLFQLLARRHGWTSRDHAAEALAINRALAAFHLDKLVDAGLVETRFERLTGRAGPGAGRPAKLYRRTTTEVTATIPDRHYDLAASILADAIVEGAASGTSVADRVGPVARSAGSAVGSDWRDFTPAPDRPETVERVLRSCGYEPQVVDPDAITLQNCPFHRLADRHRDLVCGMNLAFVCGILEGLGGAATRMEALLQPADDHCCVRIVARRRPGAPP